MSGYSNIFKEGCLISLTIKKWGSPRKIPKELLEAQDADNEWVSGYKKLVNPNALKPINTPENKAKTTIRAFALPFPIRGIWFIPKGLIEKLDLELQECKKEFEEAADEFANEFSRHMEEAEEKLGELFDSKQYPAHIRDRFYFEWRFFYLDLPSNELGILSPAQYEAEMEKMRQTVLEAEAMAIDALRTQLMKILNDAVVKLKDREARKIHASTIDKFKDFFATFRDRNIFRDNKLEDIVGLCKEALDGVDIDEIRSDIDFREQVAEELAEVKVELEKAMIRKPKRKVILNSASTVEPKKIMNKVTPKRKIIRKIIFKK